ncbi:MAG: isoleucine--tRNA ligase [Chloroflexota bacterium]|nr:MAG: isoleucine--tRNA ligase [Chloroflexota bacterium]
MFAPVDSRPDFPAMERDVLAFWNKTDAFRKLVQKNRGGPRWSFIDGPITANNPMAIHHAWGRTYKDLYQRYHAMLGQDQRYQNGFDGQGLWIEVEVEKELGFRSKHDIEAFGIDRFVELCKERVRRFSAVQTEQSIRLGYWMDWDNSYQTMSDENNFTIWTFLKRCHDRGLIYKGHDVMPWCPRCSTGLSNMEIVTDGYQELTHLSLFVKFPLVGRPGEHLLVWTTTPWTLTANVAAAVNPDLTYLKVRQGDEVLYLSKGALANALRGQHEVIGEFPGSAMDGWLYHGPFDELGPQHGVEHRVILWADVADAEGTGIVHIAPGCGAEDHDLAGPRKLAVIAPIDEFGRFLASFDWLAGRSTSQVVEDIVEDLDQKAVLYRTQPYSHRYPVCWRCSTELVFRLVDEWYISMDGPRRPGAPAARETRLRDEIAEVTRGIRWIPEFGLERELDWLRNMDDWMISKKRYYGLALPIYDCANCGTFEVIGSEHELEQRAIEGWTAFAGHSPHRPWIDAVKIACSTCGGPVTRIADVGNAWLDAGIVPFSTLGYRHGSEEWQKWFPADFITESFPGQFRNWFYSLLAQSTVLVDRAPFKTCFGFALLRDEKGEEMHKSKGNSIPFDEAAEKVGADLLRWMFCRFNPAQNVNFGYGIANDVRRRLLTLWNVYSFFITYARIDGFDPRSSLDEPSARSPLDRWILSRLNRLVGATRVALDNFDAMTACRDIEAFVEELSNWYLRRGRRRYWKSEADADKSAAYHTLYRVLVTLARLLAPFQPFLAEHLYQRLVRAVDTSAPESVHHTSYPETDATLADESTERRMANALRIVNLARAARNKAAIKVRQPLGRVVVHGMAADGLSGLEGDVCDELNVRRLEFAPEISALTDFELKPIISLLGPKYGSRLREIQIGLQTIDAGEAARSVRSGEAVRIGDIDLLPGELDVRARDRQGLAVAIEDDLAVAVDTVLTEDLVHEGLAREIVHRIQTMRRSADFKIEERIVTAYRTGPTLSRVFERFGDYIQRETLSATLTSDDSGGFDLAEDGPIEGENLRISVRRR